jgi:ABC-type lipoprotein export system ATPase subunit
MNRVAMLLLENVVKTFTEPTGRKVTVLDVPKFEIASGEQLLLQGRSGSGKTTLLHCISGIRSADSGRIVVDNYDLMRLREGAARDHFRATKIGYVFQTFNLLPAFSALENVCLGMTFAGRGVDRSRAESLLKRVDLADRLHHKPAALSVGQQQRVAVARALANRPRLLLADEPTASVDAENQDMIVELIKTTCKEEGITLLMVSHAAEVAAQFQQVLSLAEVNVAAQKSKSKTAAASVPKDQKTDNQPTIEITE